MDACGRLQLSPDYFDRQIFIGQQRPSLARQRRESDTSPRVVAIPQVGGLRQRYERRAA